MRVLATLATLLALANPAAAATYTWTAAGGDGKWSNPANWGGAAPASGEAGVALVFPALTGPYTTTNDLTGLRLAALTVATQLGSGAYTFAGNAVRIAGTAEMSSPGTGNPNLHWEIPLTLDADLTLATSGRQTRLLAPIALGAHTLTLDTAGDLVLAGAISGSGGLVKDNSSALTITGSNAYTGPTLGNAGALYISGPAAFGDAATGTTFAGGFLGFSPGSAFALAEPLRFTGGKMVVYGTPTVSGPLTLTSTLEAQVFDAAAVLTIDGPIDGAGGLTKSGPGRLHLTSAMAGYAGATRVDAGALQLDAALAASAPLTVKSGAALRGNGSTAGPIQVESGGTLAPGASPGSLAGAGLQMAADAVYAVEIDGPEAGVQHDSLAIDGAVALGGATLALALGYQPSPGERFVLIASTGSSIGGAFAALPEGAVLQAGNASFTITYAGGDVELIAGIAATPEATPSATATGAVPSASPTATPTPTGIPTTPPAGPCLGDCDGDGAVGVHELVLGVSIALGVADLTACPAFDPEGEGQVTVALLIAAVGHALDGCGA